MRPSARWASVALLLLLPLTAAPATAAESDAEPARTSPAPLLTHEVDGIDGQYIVTLRPDVASAQAARLAGVTPLHSYQRVLNGFAAKLTPAQLAAVRAMPEVAAVEQDARVVAAPVEDRAPAVRVTASSWGLDRIDQPYLPLNGRYEVTATGAGAYAFILDSGIDYAHPEFAGRVYFGYDAMGDGRRGQDCNGHGTHVAGTVGGSVHGVAREVGLVSLRVLGCDGRGSWSGVIGGLEWAAGNAGGRSLVLNASLGGPRSAAVDAATNALFDRGVLPVVAAGNEASDACGTSPAGAERALTVGASDHLDQEARFSNFGPCLDVYAPGTQIRSARLGGGSVALDGTSMASPHVAGVAALYKARNPSATPAAVGGWILEQSVKNALTVSKTSPSRLLQTGGL
ncbi:S8 family peptidase [Streptomyces fradiae]|uniref:S8 family peptidase n=1 Tax=Streptomyces fradiae TaxID=1906 RepID=UPI003828BC60